MCNFLLTGKYAPDAKYGCGHWRPFQIGGPLAMAPTGTVGGGCVLSVRPYISASAASAACIALGTIGYHKDRQTTVIAQLPTHRKTGARCIRPIGHRPHCRITIRLRQGRNPQVIPHGSGKVRLSQGSSGYSLIEQLPTHRNMDLGVLYKTWPM